MEEKKDYEEETEDPKEKAVSIIDAIGIGKKIFEKGEPELARPAYGGKHDLDLSEAETLRRWVDKI